MLFLETIPLKMAQSSKCPVKIAAISQTHTILTAQELCNVMEIQTLLAAGV